MNQNFHGRTLAAVSLSSEAEYRRGYGPLLDGFKLVDFGDIEQIKAQINENTAAVLLEPIQGEAGINIPPEGFLKECATCVMNTTCCSWRMKSRRGSAVQASCSQRTGIM